MLNKKFFFVFLLLSLPSMTLAQEEILRFACGPMKGVTLRATGSIVTIGEDGHSGNPTFYANKEKKQLVSRWGYSIPGHAGQLSDYVAKIIEWSSDEILAVERDAHGLYTYALYPKSGLVFYSGQRTHTILSNQPSLVSFWSSCSVSSE